MPKENDTDKTAANEPVCYITNMCICCGRCADVCPKHCIEEGFPRKIDQSRCTNCGKCVIVCPVEAIERR